MQAQGAPPGQYTVSFYLDDEDQVGSGSFTTDGNGNWGPGEVATWETTNRGDDTYDFYAKYIRLGVDPPPANEDGSYTVTIANTYPAWEPPDINGNGIQCSGITSPSEGTFYESSPSSFEVACSCAEATDSDHRYYISGSPQNTYPSDTLTYTWSAGTLGSWKNGINTGRNVTWVCPANYAGTLAIKCTVHDAANTSGENGNREDANKVYDVHFKVIKVLHLTQSTVPSNRGRTDLGIGERVFCWTEGSIRVDWELSGGAPLGSLSDTTDTESTIYTAPKSPASPTLHAKLSGADATVDFSVIAPSGLTAAFKENGSLGTLGPPKNKIGATSVFTLTVQATSTVSFYNASFRENIPYQVRTWPNDTHLYIGPDTVPWTCQADNTWDNDVVTDGPYDKGVLYKDGAYQNFGPPSTSISFPQEYKNDADEWVSWYPDETHPTDFVGDDTLTASVGEKMGENNTVWGGYQGPYQ